MSTRLLRCSLPLLCSLLGPCAGGRAQAVHDRYHTPIASRTVTYMPPVITRSIRQDHAGNVWFATFGGPLRFDGKMFTNLADVVGLPDTRIFSLLVDRSGAVWIGSVIDGASRWDGKTVTRFTPGPALPQSGPPTTTPEVHGLASAAVHWMHEDRQGNIWFATGGGVSRYDGTRIVSMTTADGLLHDAVYAIAEEADGRLWFGTQGGICSYDGKAFTDLAARVGREFTNVRAVAVDRSGKLWFGGQDGAFRLDGEALTAFTTADGLLDQFVGSILVDRQDRVWFGHPGSFAERKGGASRYDGKAFERFTRANGLCLDNVYCMGEDRDGNLWFGSAGDGACRWDGKTFTDLSTPPEAR